MAPLSFLEAAVVARPFGTCSLAHLATLVIAYTRSYHVHAWCLAGAPGLRCAVWRAESKQLAQVQLGVLAVVRI